MALLEVKDLTKTFTTGDKPISALEKLNLAIEEHEFVSFVGPSGCGKSTFLHIVGGFEHAESVSGAAQAVGKIQTCNTCAHHDDVDVRRRPVCPGCIGHHHLIIAPRRSTVLSTAILDFPVPQYLISADRRRSRRFKNLQLCSPFDLIPRSQATRKPATIPDRLVPAKLCCSPRVPSSWSQRTSLRLG